MNPVNILLVIALVAFIVALLDHPRVPALRCIALGLAFLTLARLFQ